MAACDSSNTNVIRSDQLGYAAAILYVLATFASRASSCLLYARLTRTKFHLNTAYIGLGSSVLGGLIGALVVVFQCKIPKVWDILDSARCLDTVSTVHAKF